MNPPPRLNLKLTPGGCEIEVPDHGLTIVFGPRKCPPLPPTIETTGESVDPTPSNVFPLRRAS